MLTGKQISDYLALNFRKLYLTDVDLNKFLAGSFQQDFDYSDCLNELVRNPDPVLISQKSITFPVFYYHSKESRIELADLTLEEIAVNAFLLLTGWQEKVLSKRDQFERFPFKESLQFKFSFHLVPVVNFLFEEICRRINRSGHSCSAERFSEMGSNIIFSHDIDRVYSGWYEGTGNLLRNPGLSNFSRWTRISWAKFIKNEDDYQAGFKRLLSLLKEWNIKSIFFFLASKSGFDADYQLTDPFFKNVIPKLINDGHIAGIHLGFETYRSPEKMKSQIARAEAGLLQKIIHNRQHFLRFDATCTPGNLLSAGIEFDFSPGFAEVPGFRNSIATPFYYFDFNTHKAMPLVGVPLFFMDGTYSHYQKAENGKMINPLESVTAFSSELNMNFSVLFHNSVFTDFKYEGFTGLFEEMVSWCRKNDFSTDSHIIWPET